MPDSKQLLSAIVNSEPKADSIYNACNDLGLFPSNPDKETAKELKGLIDQHKNKNELEALSLLLPILQKKIELCNQNKSKFFKKIIAILFDQICPNGSKNKIKTRDKLNKLVIQLPETIKEIKTKKDEAEKETKKASKDEKRKSVFTTFNKLLKTNNLYDKDYSELNRLVYLFTKKLNPNKNPNDLNSLTYDQLTQESIFKSAYTFLTTQSQRFKPLIKKIQEAGFKIDGLPEQKVGFCLALFKLILPKDHPINTNKEFATTLSSSGGSAIKLLKISDHTVFNCFPYSYSDCGLDNLGMAKFPCSDKNKVTSVGEGDWTNAHYQIPKRIASAGPQLETQVPLFLNGILNRKPAVVVNLGNPFSQEHCGFERITNPIEQNGDFIVLDPNAPYTVTTSFAETGGLNLKIQRKGVSHSCSYFILDLPDNEAIFFDKNLVDFILKVHERSKTETVIINCASGVGRTGFFLTLLALLDKLETDPKFQAGTAKFVDLALPFGQEKQPDQEVSIPDVEYIEKIFTSTLDSLRQTRYSIQSEDQIGNLRAQFLNLAAAKLGYSPELVTQLCEDARGGFASYTTMYTDKKNVSNTAKQQPIPTTTTTTSNSNNSNNQYNSFTPNQPQPKSVNPYDTFIPTETPKEPVIMPTKAKPAILGKLPSQMPNSETQQTTETTNPYNTLTQVLEIVGKNNQQPVVTPQSQPTQSTTHGNLIAKFNKEESAKKPDMRMRSGAVLIPKPAETTNTSPQNKPEPPKQEQEQTTNTNIDPKKDPSNDQSESNFTNNNI